MKLKFTRKTWYFFLLVAAAATLLNGLAVLAGQDYSFLEMVAFCITAIAVLFLSAQKGAQPGEKGAYFFVFLVLMGSYIIDGWAAYICAAAAWPMLLHIEFKRGRPIEQQMKLVAVAEALHLAFVLCKVYADISSMAFWANLLWVLLACARGWAAMTLYKTQEEQA